MREEGNPREQRATSPETERLLADALIANNLTPQNEAIRALHIALGQRAASLHRAGLLDHNELQGYFKALDEVADHLARSEGQLSGATSDFLAEEPTQFSAGAMCGACGERSAPNSAFCIHCGSPMDDGAEDSAAQCPACRAPLAPESSFCTGCGLRTRFI